MSAGISTSCSYTPWTMRADRIHARAQLFVMRKLHTVVRVYRRGTRITLVLKPGGIGSDQPASVRLSFDEWALVDGAGGVQVDGVWLS